jgi:hypothetical protein
LNRGFGRDSTRFRLHDLAPATAAPLNESSDRLATGMKEHNDIGGTSIMGKYLIGWIMGVPVIVLVIIYLIFN